MIPSTIFATPFGIGVHAVTLHQAGIERHAIEEERVEHHIVALGEIAIDRAELLDIVLAEIARRLHAGEQHRQVLRLQALDNLLQRLFGRLRRQALQRVIGAELDDHSTCFRRHRPIEPIEPVRCRIAGHAGIGDGHVVTLGLQRLLELRREGLVLRQAEARGEAVAQHNDHGRTISCHGPSRQCHSEESRCKCYKTRNAKLHLFDLFVLLYSALPCHLEQTNSLFPWTRL